MPFICAHPSQSCQRGWELYEATLSEPQRYPLDLPRTCIVLFAAFRPIESADSNITDGYISHPLRERTIKAAWLVYKSFQCFERFHCLFAVVWMQKLESKSIRSKLRIFTAEILQCKSLMGFLVKRIEGSSSDSFRIDWFTEYNDDENFSLKTKRFDLFAWKAAI